MLLNLIISFFWQNHKTIIIKDHFNLIDNDTLLIFNAVENLEAFFLMKIKLSMVVNTFIIVKKEEAHLAYASKEMLHADFLKKAKWEKEKSIIAIFSLLSCRSG